MMHMSMIRTRQVQPSERSQSNLQRWIAQWLTVMLIGLALLFPAVTYAAQPADDPGAAQQDDVLAGVDKFAQGAKESNEITLDKNMLGLAGGMMLGKKGDPKAKELMQKMDSVMVRNYEYAAPGQYKMEDVEQVRKRLDSNGWSHVVRTHTATESTDICVKTDAEGVMSEMVIINAEPLELNFIHLRGHMSPSDLSQMSGSFGGPSDPMLKQRPK
jgi:hypothetical protein